MRRAVGIHTCLDCECPDVHCVHRARRMREGGGEDARGQATHGKGMRRRCKASRKAAKRKRIVPSTSCNANGTSKEGEGEGRGRGDGEDRVI